MDPEIKFLEINLSSAPREFGHHPDFWKDFDGHWAKIEEYRENNQKEKFLEQFGGQEIPIEDFYNPLHPNVFLIPRNRYFIIDDSIGTVRMTFPFSSTDIYIDVDETKGVFCDIYKTAAFNRLNGISQLGYLVLPKPEELKNYVEIVYADPPFKHTRWMHSILTAAILDVVLARNGFSIKERASLVLIFACHDIATPAGGDSVKRVDPQNLDEELNFSWLLKHWGLDKKWKKEFGFDLVFAQSVVENVGLFGELLDVIDKIAYTALDCFAVGSMRSGKIRDLCMANPLVMDIWQDIKFSPDKKSFTFSDPERLFNFLLLRAYEFQELLFNPQARGLDLFLKDLVQPLYDKGVITKEQLLTQDDYWLRHILEEYYPEKMRSCIEPDFLSSRKFKTLKEQKRFMAKIGNRFDHAEHLSEFSSGLDWRVLSGIPLREAISKEKIKLLEEVVASTQGYYVYYQT